MKQLPIIIFHSILLAGLTLGLAEALHIIINSSDATLVHEQFLSGFYAIAPFTLMGFFIALTCASLTKVWQKTKAATDPYERSEDENARRFIGSSVSTAILTAELYVLSLFALSYLSFQSNQKSQQGLLLGIGAPVLALICFYFWSYLRMWLSSMSSPRKERRATLVIGFVAAIGITAPAVFAFQNEALMEFLGAMSVVFALAFPLLIVIFAGLMWLLPKTWLRQTSTRRVVIMLLIINGASLVDMVTELDRSEAVKASVLYNSMVLGPLVLVAQPLFDNDNDGYARLLGGGDCDDSDPTVYPGAFEIPRNGIDDDCFQGDASGVEAPKLLPPRISSEAARRVLVKRPNIIHITIDTLTAEHLGFMGYDRPTSPTLDALAQDGVHFLWAFAQGPQTRLSIPSMFTGKYFSEVERTTPLWPRIKNENLTLAEWLKQVDYRTIGIPSHRFFIPSYGLHQGFDLWDLSIVTKYQQDIPKHITGHLVTDKALAWLQKHENDTNPFYLWLHYFDPHEYYQNHADIDFGASALDRYDEEILYTDRQLGRLLKWLRSSKLSSKTYIIIHSDHGEGFGRHGYQRHGQHLYNDQVHVPLIIHGPGIEPRQVETPVGLIDLVPTIREMAGLSFSKGLRGVSLVPYIAEPDPPPHPPVFIEMLKDPTHSDRRVMISWPYKLQFGITFSEYSLYDLSQDPFEEKNLVTVRPNVFRKLQGELRRWMSTGVRPVQPSD